MLFLNGTIAEESWYDDEVTPALFKEELMAGSGDVTVWINSPGGDCVAAAHRNTSWATRQVETAANFCIDSPFYSLITGE